MAQKSVTNKLTIEDVEKLMDKLDQMDKAGKLTDEVMRKLELASSVEDAMEKLDEGSTGSGESQKLSDDEVEKLLAEVLGENKGSSAPATEPASAPAPAAQQRRSESGRGGPGRSRSASDASDDSGDEDGMPVSGSGNQKYHFIGGGQQKSSGSTSEKDILRSIVRSDVTNFATLFGLIKNLMQLKKMNKMMILVKTVVAFKIVKSGERVQTRFGFVTKFQPTKNNFKNVCITMFLNNNLELANEEIVKRTERFNNRHSVNTDVFTKVTTSDKKPEIFVLTGGNISSLSGEYEAMKNTFDQEKESMEEMMEGGAYGVDGEWAPMFDLKSVEKSDKFHEMFMKLKKELENHGKALMDSDEKAISEAIKSLAEKEREASVLLQYLEKYVRLVRENKEAEADKSSMQKVVNKYYKTLKRIDRKSSKLFGVMGGLVSAVLPIVA